jgi:hypothetical protein
LCFVPCASLKSAPEKAAPPTQAPPSTKHQAPSTLHFRFPLSTFRFSSSLAGELLRSTAPTSSPEETLAEAARRDEEIASGKVRPLTEAEFWRGVKNR